MALDTHALLRDPGPANQRPRWIIDEKTLRHGAKDGIVSTDGRAVLIIVSLGVTDLVELRCGCEHAAAEPDGISLHLV